MAANSTSRREAVKSAKRMAGFDFATWRSAADDPVMRSSIIGLILMEKAPDWQTLTERFDRVSRTNIVLRQKVIDQGGLTTPRLVVDRDFDLTFHLRRFRMPAGSTWHDVLEDARRQSMTDFDKDRPLWRVTVLEGLPGGQAAMILKLHHAIADGQGAVMIAANIFDFSEAAADLGPMPPAPVGQDLDRVGFAEAVVRDNFGWAARTTQEFIEGVGPATLAAVKHPNETARRISRTVGSLARFTAIPMGPLSPLMTERSINYHFGTFDIPFADIKHVGKEAHHTANDVFLAAVGEGLGLYHKKLGKPVDKLRVNMPVSTRGSGDGVENAVNIARFELPTVLDESRNVMDQVSKTVRKMRDEPAMAFANQLGELSRFIPSEIVAAAAQASDVTASNVPGVPVPVWLAGARVTRMYPLVATIGAAVNITLLTYNGTASVGISTDDAAVSEPELMLEALRQGFADVIGKHVPATSPLSVGNSESRTTIAQTAPTGTADETQAKPKSVKRTAKTVAKRAPAKKTVVKKAPTKKTVVKKAPAKKTVVKRTPTKKTVVKKAPAKKTVVKRTPTKQTVAKRAPAKKAPAKKATKRQ